MPLLDQRDTLLSFQAIDTFNGYQVPFIIAILSLLLFLGRVVVLDFCALEQIARLCALCIFCSQREQGLQVAGIKEPPLLGVL